MAKHPVKTITYHTLHDDGGYREHPNANRAPILVPPPVQSFLNGRHIGSIPKPSKTHGIGQNPQRDAQ